MISAPPSVVTLTACFVSNITVRTPLAGATILPFAGITATPFPRISWLKVGSLTSLNGTTFPSTGARIFSLSFSLPENIFFNELNMFPQSPFFSLHSYSLYMDSQICRFFFGHIMVIGHLDIIL